MNIKRSYLAATHDMLMLALSFVLSFSLMFHSQIMITDKFILFYNILLILLIGVINFNIFNIYSQVWRYCSIQDLIIIIKAITTTIIIFFLILFLVNRLENIPSSFFLINWMVLLLLIAGPRLIYRIYQEQLVNFDLFDNDDLSPILILLVGINNDTESFIRNLLRSHSKLYKVIGIITDDSSRIGSKINNIKVYGNYSNLEAIYLQLKKQNKTPQKLIISDEHLTVDEINYLLNTTDSLGMTIAKLPKFTDFQTTSNNLDIKPIAIEDLLGRAQNTINNQQLNDYINNKIILVTGCGGTIGGELCLQIANNQPSQLILVDQSEYNLYQIDKKLEERYPKLNKVAIIADIRNIKLLDKIFSDHPTIAVVLHAAALKHVPLVENNSCEAILTNILGTKNIADCCIKYQIASMLLISSDKAVNPTNIMGLTKRVAECYINSLANNNSSSLTKFITVRFGNVMGSSGSVIPLFYRQLSEGGPITITHPEITRYFMTVKEAVGLVLQTLIISQSIKQNAIFILDMGKPYKIKDLAIQIIKLAGLKIDDDIKISYIGLRAGEKLFEELFYNFEQPIQTDHKSIMIAKTIDLEPQLLISQVKQLIKLAQNYKISMANQLLSQIVDLCND